MLGTDALNTHALFHFPGQRQPIFGICRHAEVADSRRGLETNCHSFRRLQALSDTSTTMAAPGKPMICVAPATEDDYDQIVEWAHTIMDSGDPITDYVFPHQERAFKDIPRTREAFTNSSSKTFKAVLTDSKRRE